MKKIMKFSRKSFSKDLLINFKNNEKNNKKNNLFK